MVYLATQEVVQRVRPLLERLATRTIDKARLLQYLSAMAGVCWQLFEIVARETTPTGETVTILDRAADTMFVLPYPECLPPDLEPLVIAEYLRLATHRPLTTMDTALFDRFFSGAYCAGCQWQGERQVCHECHYAGHPINFTPFHPEAAPPLDHPSAPLDAFSD